jgi:hypothetical protein
VRIGSRSKLDEKHKTIRTKTQRSAVEKSLALAFLLGVIVVASSLLLMLAGVDPAPASTTFTATDTADPDNGDRDASG